MLGIVHSDKGSYDVYSDDEMSELVILELSNLSRMVWRIMVHI
jgi:hypothetical protein